jgi:hypothetical protein
VKKIEVQLDEVKEIFLLLEELQRFLHQPMNYQSKEDFEKFVHNIYPDVHKSYYETVWNWLPQDIQSELEER